MKFVCFSKAEIEIGELFNILLKTSFAFGLIGMFCELCERIGDGFEEISDAVHNLDWYLYPLEVQRMLPIILHNAQQPVVLEAFGNVPFTRDTFKKVIQKVYYTIS